MRPKSRRQRKRLFTAVRHAYIAFKHLQEQTQGFSAIVMVIHDQYPRAVGFVLFHGSTANAADIIIVSLVLVRSVR